MVDYDLVKVEDAKKSVNELELKENFYKYCKNKPKESDDLRIFIN